MKLRSLLNSKTIMESQAVPSVFKKLFSKFPRDAKNWSSATDEIRDVCRIVRELYNEMELDLTSADVENGKGIQSLNFRTFKTPSEWNSKSQDFIVKVWGKLSSHTKQEALRQLKSYMPTLF